MNSVTSIIVPELTYKQRIIKAVVEKCINEISPIATYIEITHLSDKSVTWVPRADIDSFQSVKKKRGHQRNIKSQKNKADEIHSRNSSISSTTSPQPFLHSMPTTIVLDHITNPDSTSITMSKLAAIAKIEETTQKGRLLLDTAVANKTTAIVNLQKDYGAILVDWDKTKNKLDKETQHAIMMMNVAKDESSQLLTDINTSKSDITTLNEDMLKIIEEVKTVVVNTTVNINNDNLDPKTA